jgi:spore maturation protein CgeB
MEHVKNGYLAGRGWDSNKVCYPCELHNREISVDQVWYYYANSLVSLNFHQQDQIDYYVDCNERTFIVPSCCGFQVMDRPMVLEDMYTREEVVSCKTPDEYFSTVVYFIEHPEERIPYIEKALERTYLEHTYFHVLKRFINFLNKVVEGI